jgi:8-oxo-dGTP pyrophosphatase MutT (NUDIX family)
MPVHYDEIVQIVDRQNRKTEHLPRSVMRAQGLTHRASYILVFNDKNEFFLQKRTVTKDIFPGFWDVAAGGVVLADESYEESAVRELAEELGLSGVPLHFLFDHYYEDGGNKVWGRVFSCRHNGPFILQESEVAGGRFISVADALLLKDREPFTPDGVQILIKLQSRQPAPPGATFFLHGLDSSSQGAKGRFFAEHFPHVHCPDFSGTLAERMLRLDELCRDLSPLIFIGSSFGGLMATCYAMQHPTSVARLILLSPALNFHEFQPPHDKLPVPTLLIIGSEDTVTPPVSVLPLARQTFADLEIEMKNDDHLLHGNFHSIAWHPLLMA